MIPTDNGPFCSTQLAFNDRQAMRWWANNAVVMKKVWLFKSSRKAWLFMSLSTIRGTLNARLSKLAAHWTQEMQHELKEMQHELKAELWTQADLHTSRHKDAAASAVWS